MVDKQKISWEDVYKMALQMNQHELARMFSAPTLCFVQGLDAFPWQGELDNYRDNTSPFKSQVINLERKVEDSKTWALYQAPNAYLKDEIPDRWEHIDPRNRDSRLLILVSEGTYIPPGRLYVPDTSRRVEDLKPIHLLHPIETLGYAEALVRMKLVESWQSIKGVVKRYNDLCLDELVIDPKKT